MSSSSSSRSSSSSGSSSSSSSSSKEGGGGSFLDNVKKSNRNVICTSRTPRTVQVKDLLARTLTIPIFRKKQLFLALFECTHTHTHCDHINS